MSQTTFIPITPPQLRTIHALVRALGVDKEDIYAVYHVGSLKDLSVIDASRLIDRLKASLAPEQRRRWTAHDPAPASAAPPAIRLVTDATVAQRIRIAALFDELGWDDRKASGWLVHRFQLYDLANARFARADATSAIKQLQAALRRSR